jgi:glutamyl-tRNA reductase
MTETAYPGLHPGAGDGALLFAAGLSFKTAPIELREQLAVAPSDQEGMVQRLKLVGGLSEIVLLWTCNRVEIYGVAPQVNGNIEAMFRCLTPESDGLGSKLYCHQGPEAARHLFRVASGLDSMVLGETDVIGQVKNAYETARSASLTGRVLNKVFQKALQTAKEIRTRTRIGQGATSVGSVAVMHAQGLFGPQLADQTIMIIGAGKMAETCVRHFAKKGAKTIIVANRSWPRAEQLADQFGGRAVHFERYLEAMADADIVVSSTGCPVTIIDPPDVELAMRERPDRPLFMIDIAVPRDINPEVGKMDNVHLYDIDDLESTVRDNTQHREQDLELCASIIGRKVSYLAPHLDSTCRPAHEAGV